MLLNTLCMKKIIFLSLKFYFIYWDEYQKANTSVLNISRIAFCLSYKLKPGRYRSKSCEWHLSSIVVVIYTCSLLEKEFYGKIDQLQVPTF